MTVRGFIGAVEPFNHLFEWSVFRRNGITVGKPNHLSDLERKALTQLLFELHCGERTCVVAVRDELKVLRQLCKASESHTHSEDTRADATVIGDLVADDGTGGGFTVVGGLLMGDADVVKVF